MKSESEPRLTILGRAVVDMVNSHHKGYYVTFYDPTLMQPPIGSQFYRTPSPEAIKGIILIWDHPILC